MKIKEFKVTAKLWNFHQAGQFVYINFTVAAATIAEARVEAKRRCEQISFSGVHKEYVRTERA